MNWFPFKLAKHYLISYKGTPLNPPAFLPLLSKPAKLAVVSPVAKSLLTLFAKTKTRYYNRMANSGPVKSLWRLWSCLIEGRLASIAAHFLLAFTLRFRLGLEWRFG